MEIYVKQDFLIIGIFHSQPVVDSFDFTVNVDDERKVEINFAPIRGVFKSVWKVNVSNALYDFFKTGKYKSAETTFIHDELQITHLMSEKLVEEFYSDLFDIQYGLFWASERLLKFFKFWLHHTDLTGVRGLDCFWSEDGINWKPCPLGRSDYIVKIIPVLDIDNENLNEIQKCINGINNKYEPFFALDFLHNAINESNPKQRWIYATIAAELAIKEYLIRKDPLLENILIEMQSPPLRILYGKVLEAYGGIKLGVDISDIHYGSEVRNCLVHRPQDIEINPHQAEAYVRIIESAILQLFSSLYPEISITKQLYPPYKHLEILKRIKKC